jgi:N-acetylmuramoyl-L-alanine amidase
MTTSQLQTSLEHWENVEAWNRPRWRAAKKGTSARTRYYLRLKQAKVMVARRRKQLAKATGVPKIVRLNAPMEQKFGALGPITAVIGHYTAGPRDKNLADALRLWGQYNAQHRAQGWGAIGYHYGIASDGTIVLLRPIGWKGAHTAGANSGHPGIVMHGTTGDRATEAQARSVRWLAANAHTGRMPTSHRAPKRLDSVKWTGHNDWNSTACPGSFKTVYVSKGQDR